MGYTYNEPHSVMGARVGNKLFVYRATGDEASEIEVVEYGDLVWLKIAYGALVAFQGRKIAAIKALRVLLEQDGQRSEGLLKVAKGYVDRAWETNTPLFNDMMGTWLGDSSPERLKALENRIINLTNEIEVLREENARLRERNTECRS